jgi:hypothetical protein
MKGIDQRLAPGYNGVDHQLMSTLGEYRRHLVGDNVVDEGDKCAGTRVHDDVGVGRMAGDLLHQIVKTAWINAAAFVRSFNEIDFGGGQGCKGGESAIDWIGVVTADLEAFIRQILSQ